MRYVDSSESFIVPLSLGEGLACSYTFFPGLMQIDREVFQLSGTLYTSSDENFLSAGHFGTVYDLPGSGLVVKAVNPLEPLKGEKEGGLLLQNQASVQMLRNEVHLLNTQGHAAFLFQNPSNQFDCRLVMPHLGVSLEKFFQDAQRDDSLDLKERYKILLGLAEALQGLHEKGYVHRDFHTKNILIKREGEGYHIALIDGAFLAQSGQVGFPHPEPQQFLGEHVAPELKSEEGSGWRSCAADPTQDVYSLSAIMQYLDEQEVKQEVANSDDRLRQLVEQGLSEGASDRPLLCEFIDELEKRYIAQIFKKHGLVASEELLAELSKDKTLRLNIEAVDRYLNWSDRHAKGSSLGRLFHSSHGGKGRQDAKQYLYRLSQNATNASAETRLFLSGGFVGQNLYQYALTSGQKAHSRISFFSQAYEGAGMQAPVFEYRSLKSFAHTRESYILSGVMLMASLLALGVVLAATHGAALPIVAPCLLSLIHSSNAAVLAAPAAVGIVGNRVAAASSPRLGFSSSE